MNNSQTVLKDDLSVDSMSDCVCKNVNTEWSTSRNWYNDRVMDTYISAPIVDKQGDMIPTETIKESMDFYMKHGIYSYKHDEIPIGQPLAYKVKNGKVLLRVGIHNKLDMHNKVWKEIQQYGSRGASSIRGEALNQNKVCPPNEACFTKIDKLGLWSVSWVGDSPANPEATVQTVSMAKEEENIGKNVSENELEDISHIKKCAKCNKPVKKCGTCNKTIEKRPVDPRERMRYARTIQNNGTVIQAISDDLNNIFTARLMSLRDYSQKALTNFNQVYPQPRDSDAKKLQEFVEQCLRETLELLIEGKKIMKKADDLDRLMDATYKMANPRR